jgi:hypothetical protein
LEVRNQEVEGFRVGGVFLFNEVNWDLVEYFTNVNVKWDKKVGGVCEVVNGISVEEVINLENDFENLLSEYFENKVAKQSVKHKSCNPIEDIYLMVLKVKIWLKKVLNDIST